MNLTFDFAHATVNCQCYDYAETLFNILIINLFVNCFV